MMKIIRKRLFGWWKNEKKVSDFGGERCYLVIERLRDEEILGYALYNLDIALGQQRTTLMLGLAFVQEENV